MKTCVGQLGMYNAMQGDISIGLDSELRMGSEGGIEGRRKVQ